MIRINLLKPEKKELKEAPPVPPEEFERKRKIPLPSLLILLCFVIIIILFFYQKNAISDEKERIQEAQEEKRKLQDVIVKLEKLEKQKDLYERKIDLIQKLKSQQDVPIRILLELSTKIPDWVWLTETKYSDKTVEIKGRAMSHNMIADYIFNLERSAHFENVELISSTQRTVLDDTYLEFSLAAKYILPYKSKSSPSGDTKGEKK
jgi:Tfp pilus assembly protein PilN